ncbi:hypothetical protein [Clostridium sp. LP20]|uniref:hypothetical protein n=1 Tax=Clostridium sp. LP20 TaxID=3418665 RepID=UPI003EE4E3CF
MNLLALKQKYNKCLERNRKAEEFFKTHTVQQCEKKLELFNEVVRQLSLLKIAIEIVSGKKLTDHEILNGFEPRG